MEAVRPFGRREGDGDETGVGPDGGDPVVDLSDIVIDGAGRLEMVRSVGER